jgi:DNA-binding SARP family transcriptional activator/TolB-like protein
MHRGGESRTGPGGFFLTGRVIACILAEPVRPLSVCAPTDFRLASMLTFRAFGGACLTHESGALSGPASQRRRLALLALLSASPSGGMSREKVTGLLWPDSDGETARHRLGDALHALRKALGRDAILSVGDELHLNPQVVQSDLSEFRRALGAGEWQTAVSLYRGSFLEGFFIPDASEFERWMDVERERLAREFAQALTSLAEESERDGDWSAAIEWWHRLVTHDPYSSRATLRLMLACVKAGDAGAALQHARVHEAALREDLAAEPDAHLAALVAGLRHGPSGGVTPAREGGGAPSRIPTAAASESTAPLLPAAAIAADDGARAPPVVHALLEPALSSRSNRRWIRWAAMFGLALSTVIVAGLPNEPREAELLLAAVDLPIRSLAVLPFENCTPDPRQPGRSDVSQDYFADQLTVELITRLAQIPDVRVTSRISAMRYTTACGSPRRQGISLRQIADELGVDAILEGTLVRHGESLRVTVQLIRTATDEHLWAGALEYERSIADVLRLQEEIVREIAGAIRLHAASVSLLPMYWRWDRLREHPGFGNLLALAHRAGHLLTPPFCAVRARRVLIRNAARPAIR